MDMKYKSYLEDWERDPKVACVLVVSSSSRAFSAGMDIKGIVAEIQKDRNTPLIQKVFAAEYSLICKISGYTKPYISFLDGITMGFGIGLSCHGRYRIITERTVLGMPENGIGLFPDIGFAYISARSPGGGALGYYLGMTGKRILSPADALYAGLGTHYVPSKNLGLVKAALSQHIFGDDSHNDVKVLLSEHSMEPESESQLKNLLPAVVSTFNLHKPVSDLIVELKKHQLSSETGVAEWAKDALLGLDKGAPFSLCLTQRHFLQVASGNSDHHPLEVESVMKTEYRVAMRASRRNDFAEGVRAVLVDKDQNPRWDPQKVEDVDFTELASLFDPLEPSVRELDGSQAHPSLLK